MKFISDITVTYIDHMGNDSRVVAAAKVSTSGIEAAKLVDKEANRGIINFLMKKRHGTPFEHGALTLFVHAPIFVWREWHRHRVGFSYNEESARYKQLDPVFWIPKESRKMMPVPDPGDECIGKIVSITGGPSLDCLGRLEKKENGLKQCVKCTKVYQYHAPSRPCFGPAKQSDYVVVEMELKDAYAKAYLNYESMIQMGVAKEVARACLPVAIYSACWVTLNPRSLMHFLSLRTHEPEAKFPSFPQAEIEEAARQVESIFKEHWPITWDVWNENGRVAP